MIQLPENISVNKDAKYSLTKAAKLFVQYLTAASVALLRHSISDFSSLHFLALQKIIMSIYLHLMCRHTRNFALCALYYTSELSYVRF
jgi:hypothetical protein